MRDAHLPGASPAERALHSLAGRSRLTAAKRLPPLCLLMPVHAPLSRWICTGRLPLLLHSGPRSLRERGRAFPMRGSSGLRARRGTSPALPSATSPSLRSFAPAIRDAASTPPRPRTACLRRCTRSLPDFTNHLSRLRHRVATATHALLLPVALVADQNLADALAGVLLNVRVPRPDVWRVAQHAAVSRCPGRPSPETHQHSLLKLFSSVTSYTSRMPIAPR